MVEHSATPWVLCHHLQSAEKDASCKCGYRGSIWGDSGELLVCEMRNCDLHEGHDMTPVGDRATQLANAAFIVKAVNNHAPMVRSLEQCAQLFDVLATTMERWATESREGGWSTHQVAENRVRAGDCRRYAATIRSALPGDVGNAGSGS